MIKIIKDIAPKDQHYFIAVSMGIDSVAAFLWLRSKNYNITPIHFNHKLRPQNDLMESKFIELCDKLNIEYKIGHGCDLLTEKDCRQARLNFYNSVVEGSLITAHHLNDYVESYLLNCFRGHPHHRSFELVSYFDNYKIIHPFLLTCKKDFEQFLARNDYLKYTVQDESNFITKGSRRNWIRNAIVPEMKQNKLSLEKFAKRSVIKLINSERVK